MHRRGFLASLAAVALAPLAPSGFEPWSPRMHAYAIRFRRAALQPITLGQSVSIDFGWEEIELAQTNPPDLLRYMPALPDWPAIEGRA